MGYRVSLIVICVVWIVGCVEMGQMLTPRADGPPDLANQGSQNGGADENEATNDADGDETTGEDEDTDNANDNGVDPDSPIFGGIGDIPKLEGLEPITTDSGLTYIDIEEGEGQEPGSPTANVTVNYVGWLTDGTEFDSGEGVGFNLLQVIPGWTEGVASMRVGGSRRLLIPPDLAYGAGGAPPTIPPAATLVFDVDLLSIED